MRCNWLMLMVGLSFLTLFFLQAADGIRYRNVTGVQTCALPISEAVRTEKLGQVADEFDHVHTVQRAQEVGSEERRVGKECRSRWWACHLKKKLRAGGRRARGDHHGDRRVAHAGSHEEIECLFFFQAEDGIRDRNVTGVQTCALPI